MPLTSAPDCAATSAALTLIAPLRGWTVNEQDIRTPQHIKNRDRDDPGILATDMQSISCRVSSTRVMRLENRIGN
jgi:hypothetical protein